MVSWRVEAACSVEKGPEERMSRSLKILLGPTGHCDSKWQPQPGLCQAGMSRQLSEAEWDLDPGSESGS